MSRCRRHGKWIAEELLVGHHVLAGCRLEPLAVKSPHATYRAVESPCGGGRKAAMGGQETRCRLKVGGARG